MEPLLVFMDESGDLGQSFRHPGGKGGSTRFFTLAAVGFPASAIDFMEQEFKKWSLSQDNETVQAQAHKKSSAADRTEQKWNTAPTQKKVCFARWLKELHAAMNGQLTISAITVDKMTLPRIIGSDPNLLFMAMAKKLVTPLAHNQTELVLNHDERTVKSRSKNSLHEQIQGAIWFESNQPALLRTFERDSRDFLMVQLADMVSGLVRQAYEQRNDKLWNMVRPCLQHTMLNSRFDRDPSVSAPVAPTHNESNVVNFPQKSLSM